MAKYLRSIAIALCLFACLVAVARWTRSPHQYEPAVIVLVMALLAALLTLVHKLVKDAA